MVVDTSSLVFSQKEQRENIKDGSITAWHCRTCDHKSVTPMYICPKDMSRDIDKVALPTEGEVVSFTIQKISIEAFINEVPFAFLVVKLDDGTLVPGWMGDVWKDSDIPVGQRVRQEGTYKPGILFEKI